MRWLLEAGFRDFGALKNVWRGQEGRTMVARRPVARGTPEFAVPINCTVYVTSPHLAPETEAELLEFGRRFRMPGAVVDDYEMAQMGLIVMVERTLPHSYWAPYFAVVQDPISPPLFTEEQLDMLQYDLLKQYSTYFISDAISALEVHAERSPRFRHLPPQQRRHDIIWALQTVMQRAFDWGPDNRREYVLVPYLDMINHRFNVANSYYYTSRVLANATSEPFAEHVTSAAGVEFVRIPHSMAINADKDYVEGEEVAISYSFSSNTVQLLLQYGFVLDENPSDYLMIAVRPSKNDQGRVPRRLLPYVGNEELKLRESVTVGRDGLVPEGFVKLASVCAGGGPEVSPLGARAIVAALDQHVRNDFKTSQAEDEVQLATPGLGRAEWSAISYRIVARRFVQRVRGLVSQHLLAKLEAGETPVYGEHSGRTDWPVRVVLLDCQEPDEAAADLPWGDAALDGA